MLLCNINAAQTVLRYSHTSLRLIQPLVPSSGYREFVLYSTLGHVGGGTNFGGHTLMRVATTQAGNGALVYRSQGGRYRAESCMALG